MDSGQRWLQHEKDLATLRRLGLTETRSYPSIAGDIGYMELNSIRNLQERKWFQKKSNIRKSPGGAPRSYFSYLVMNFLGEMRTNPLFLVFPGYPVLCRSASIYQMPLTEASIKVIDGTEKWMPQKGVLGAFSWFDTVFFLRSKGVGKEHSINDHYWTNLVLFKVAVFPFCAVFAPEYCL